MSDDIRETVAAKARELLVLAEQVEASSPMEFEAAVAVRCGEIMVEIRAMQVLVGKRRSAAVRYLLGQGLTFAEAGAACGISRQRAQQLADK